MSITELSLVIAASCCIAGIFYCFIDEKEFL